MTFRRPLAVLLAAGLALATVACSDDGSEDGSSSSSTTTSAPAQATTTTITDAQYQAIVGEARTAMEQAGDDLCALSAITAPEPPAPANEEQTKMWVELYKAAHDALAATVEAEDPEAAETLRAGAAKMADDAAAANYDPSFASSENPPAALVDPEFVTAIEAATANFASECGTPGAEGGSGSPDTTVPDAAPEG